MESAAIFDRARLRPGEPAIVDAFVQLSWNEAAHETSRIGNTLLEFGFAEGARLGVLGSNCSRTLLTYAGAALAGVGTILINHHLTATEAEYMLRDGRAAAVWASEDCMNTAVAAAGRLGIPVLTDSGQLLPGATFLEEAHSSPPPTDLGATTDLIYTSGTTGKPKGVEVPTQPAPTVADRLELAAGHHMAGLGAHLVAGPLYHAGPHGAVGLLISGDPVVLVERFDAELVVDAIERHRIATSVMVPTHLVRLMALPEGRRRSANVSSLRLISLTGSSCPYAVKKAMIDWFGPVFREAYGASESGIISHISSDEWLAHPGSVGRPQPPFRAIVVDEEGSPCAPGRDGVLYFEDQTGRGIRYFNDPEKTAAAHLRPGTFTLGDVGHVDEDGYLYITGRVTDMVISGGVNIYPAECEGVLAEHHSVRDVALFGVPDDEMGERLVGLVCTNGDETSVDELIAFCRGCIAAYKVPRQLAQVTDIPRSPMGKIDKSAARQVFLDLTLPGQ